MNVNRKAWVGLVVVVIAMAVLLFGIAGTLAWWQAWIYLAIYSVASALITLYLVRHDPELLRRRMSGGPWAEKEPTQKIIMGLATIGFAASLIVPALDRHFIWSRVPAGVVIAGNIMTVAWFYAMYRVFKENSFTSATIEIADNQRVISTGPYAWVRHPMYAGAMLLFFGMPLALGSYWGVLAFVVVFPALVWRLLDEERFLVRNLAGYADYCTRVRWRLLPGVF